MLLISPVAEVAQLELELDPLHAGRHPKAAPLGIA
jgi:hypothetical protein